MGNSAGCEIIARGLRMLRVRSRDAHFSMAEATFSHSADFHPLIFPHRLDAVAANR